MLFEDTFKREILPGALVVYPARPGGRGPLVLEAAHVDSLDHALGEITVIPVDGNRPVRISRWDRVAVVA